MASRLLAAAVAIALLAPAGPVRAQIEDSQAGPALPLDGADAGSFRRRGDRYRDAGDYDRAVADYGEALARTPDDIEALRGRAVTLDILRRPREAVADYSRLLAKAPDDGSAHANRAALLTVLQNAPGAGFRSRTDYDLALADFDAAFRLLPAEYEGKLRFARGDLLAQHGDAAPALAEFEAAVKLAPDDKKALVRLSHARREAGDAAGAKAALEAASRLPYDPSRPDEVDDELAALRPPGEPEPPPPPPVQLKVRAAETVTGENGEPVLRITLDDESAKRLEAFSAANVGWMIEAKAGDEVLTQAVIREPLTAPSFDISGPSSKNEKDELAKRISGREIIVGVVKR